MQLKQVTALAAVIAAMTFAGCSDIINRDDFVTLLRNKTEPEVMQIAGKPAAVDATDQSHVVWIYKQRTFDVPTRRKDPETDVVFSPGEDGKMHVAEVTFKEHS